MEWIIPAVFGSGGILGLLWYFTRLYIEKRLMQAEARAQRHRQIEIERYKLDDEFEHALGRVLFWLVHGVKRFDTGHQFFNGELQESFEKLLKVEENIKNFNLAIRAEAERRG